MKRNIILFASDPTWGAVSNFNEMFNTSDKYTAYEILLMNDNYYNFGKNIPNKIIYSSNNKQIKDLVSDINTIFFLFDAKGMNLFKRCADDMGINIKKRSINIFWSGTPYRKSSKECNIWVKENNVIAYAMMDLIRLGNNSIPLMQPHNTNKYLKIRKDIKKKSDKLIICHSPGNKGKDNRKGTRFIEKVISQIQKKYKNIEYVQIGKKSGPNRYVSHAECIKLKATADIFVEKCGKHTAGGLGKSGMEAICLGIPTISALHDSRFDNRYKDLFVISGNTEKELYDQLVLLIENKSYYNEVVQKTLDTASVINYSNTLAYMEKTMAK